MVVAYIAYGAAMLSLIVLRYKKPYKDIERPFKVQWNKKQIEKRYKDIERLFKV